MRNLAVDFFPPSRSTLPVSSAYLSSFSPDRLKVEATKRPDLASKLSTLGQGLHQISSRINVFASGYKFLGVKPLAAEDATSKAVNFLSETFVFTVAGTIIVVEYARSEAKNAEKAKKAADEKMQEKKQLEERFQMIIDRLDDLEASRLSQLHCIETSYHLQEYLEERREARIAGNPLPDSFAELQQTRLDIRKLIKQDKTPTSLPPGASSGSWWPWK